MSAPLIETRELWKVYDQCEVPVVAVRETSLSIPHRQFVAISGASGSGKSTFMHLIGCLDRPSQGSLMFEEHEVSKLSKKQLAALRNRRIGFIFQSFNLLGRTTVLDNVALPLAYQGVSLRKRRERAAETLGQLGLGDRMRHLPNQLSGGQQQRVAIARALVTRPAILLADEPTGNLDSDRAVQIMLLFKELNEREGITIVLVTHEMNLASYAARHVVFSDGRIVSDDAVRAGGNGHGYGSSEGVS
jgi:putative ABC transport system ATP-binding protein